MTPIAAHLLGRLGRGPMTLGAVIAHVQVEFHLKFETARHEADIALIELGKLGRIESVEGYANLYRVSASTPFEDKKEPKP